MLILIAALVMSKGGDRVSDVQLVTPTVLQGLPVVEAPWAARVAEDSADEPKSASSAGVPEPQADGPGSIEALIVEAMGPEWVPIFECESGLNPLAEGSHGERGIGQVHPVNMPIVSALGYTWNQMFEPQPNLRVAQEILARQGPGAWSCAR